MSSKKRRPSSQNPITPLESSPDEAPIHAKTSEIWIRGVLDSTLPLQATTEEDNLITKILASVLDNPIIPLENRSISLAAGFDLLLAAQYYASIAHTGWHYCGDSLDIPLRFYAYTNTCPRCVLKGKFVHVAGNKPSSGAIGAMSRRLLLLYIQALFKRMDRNIEIRIGTEPVDAIFIDTSTEPITLLFAEIKAAPLVTLPLAGASQPLYEEYEGQLLPIHHRASDFSNFFGSEVGIWLPKTYNEGWSADFYSIGSKSDAHDHYWAYRGIGSLLDSSNWFLAYLNFWLVALDSYANRTRVPPFWFTNGCGSPFPRPSDWAGTTISDSKSSVGMDRTDDIKKATYQVLKLSAEGKPNSDYAYKTAIISNIHAIRHFEDYFTALKDIVWTREATGSAKLVGDLDPNLPIFNLFDGIIALTDVIDRDEWIRRVFDFTR
jgi:hypothetical protein